MKGLKRWKQGFYYALFDHDDLTDGSGNYTGEPRAVYKEPVFARAHVSEVTGSSTVEVFGVDTKYDRVIFWDSGDCPITETTAIILDGEPQYDADGNLLFDHIVKRVVRSFNSTMIGVMQVNPLDYDSDGEAEPDDGD